jgi:POT family proton-dependent oligopeptide transporter
MHRRMMAHVSTRARANIFAGQPKGLSTLFLTEMWERFSYYGMRALLVLYLIDHLLKPERINTAIGLSELKSLLESFGRSLDSQAFASEIYGLYTSLVYLTPIVGGLIADRWLGRTRTVVLGAMLMILGHFLMANEKLFLVALLVLILGVGAFKPNISIQVGELYDVGDARRDRAYSIFYVGINIGAFLAPLIAGSLGELAGWDYGFASAGVGMTIALIVYLRGWRNLPTERRTTLRASATQNASAAPAAWRVIFLLFAPSVLFWAAFEQQGNTIVFWAENFVDREISISALRLTIPTTWFQTLNPLMIFLFTPPLVAFWTRQSQSGREPSTIRKLALGCFGVGCAYLVLALSAAADARTSPFWLVAYFAIITVSELFFSPIALSLVSGLAPQGARAVIMGLWFLSIFAGNLLGGWIGSLWSDASPTQFFLLVAAIATAGGVWTILIGRQLDSPAAR